MDGKDEINLLERENRYKRISKNIKLKDKTVNVEINYFHELKDGEWAERVFNLVSGALPLIENVSGLSYPRNYRIKIYEATFEDVGRNDGENREAEGIWIKPQAMDSYIVHEVAHCFTDISDESWIMEGLADLYAYLVLKEMKKAGDAGRLKSSAFSEYYKYLRFDEDFPLDGWDPLTEKRNRVYFGYGKSFIFIYMIHEKYGLDVIRNVNGHLHKNGVKAASLNYKIALEKFTRRNMDEFFSGWIFPGEYKVMPDEIREVEKYDGSDLSRSVLKKLYEKF